MRLAAVEDAQGGDRILLGHEPAGRYDSVNLTAWL